MLDLVKRAAVAKPIANQTTPYDLSELREIVKGATLFSIDPCDAQFNDRNQLGPLQISKGARINEFGLQSSHGLYDRILLHKFPSTQLSVLLPRICILVNQRIYINRLVNDESTRN